MTRTLKTLVFGLLVSLATAGCNNPSRAATGQASEARASAKSAQAKVAKIVFVGVERACDCTRSRVDAGWATLQKALGKPAKLPVERFQIDTQSGKVAPYRKQKPMIALPAVYFVDEKDSVIELLQGEVSEAEILALLGK